MNEFEHRGKTWEYSFVKLEGILKEQDRVRLLMGFVDMYIDKRKTAKIKGEDFDAQAVDTRKYQVFPSGLGGKRYECAIESTKGKAKIGVLILEKIDSSLN